MFWRKKHIGKEDKYKERTLELKNESKRMLSEFLVLDHSIKKTIADFNNGDAEARDIPFSELDKFPIYEWIDFNDKIRSRVVEKSEEEIVFESHFKKGGTIGEHFHSDIAEILNIVSGCIFCPITGSRAEANEDIFFPVNQIHTPRAMEDTFVITKLIKWK